MSKFLPHKAYYPDESSMALLPITFERLDTDRFVVANIVGDFTILTETSLRKLIDLELAPGDGLYEEASEKLLIAHEGQRSHLQLLALRLRSRLSFLRHPTPLHIFVVTLRCEHSCPYCQVSRQSYDRKRFDMSCDVADKAIDIAFASLSPEIKIEFQGGEPLLNFDVIKHIVVAAAERSKQSGKSVQFVITSNLALLDSDHLEFCRLNNIMLSTSLDGPADLHNANRPRPGGNSHQLVVDALKKAKQWLGDDRVGALMTTTNSSLHRVKEIIDEYVRNDLDGIFLRPLSPYGFAIKTKSYDRYGVDEWCRFYEEGLRYILEINRGGRPFPEFYARLLMRRMYSDTPTGYVDLRSPAGIGLGALVYNYDGKVFASDEGRMLAEMKDDRFAIGDVHRDDYQSLILSDTMTSAVSASLTQCAPMCSSCAFEPHCGADPVYHYATQGDYAGIKPMSAFCGRQKFMFKLLIDIIENSADDAAILRGWLQ